ncbi:MAG: aspartate aminotransferase [Spirochaetes bacterium DG_61]|nr:MAG: aspartate aminotransferase [Spirochaetes bacterium DG_61]
MAIAFKIKEMMGRASWIRRMFDAGNTLKEQYGQDRVCDFSLGNPNMDPPPEFVETVVRIIRDEIPAKHSYMPNAGYPEVRKKVAEYVSSEQKVPLTGNHVVLTCGAGGGMNVVLKTLLNHGDRMLVSKPFFMEYAFYVDNHGGTLEPVEGKNNFDLDIDEIAAHITPTTTAVIINSPNNPSGMIYPESTIAALGEMLTKKSSEMGRSIYLVSDEPYRKIVYDGYVVPSVCGHYRNSIVVNSYSKDLSIPGERIGWVAVHPDADDAEDIINGMILCNRILGFVNAPALMQRVIYHLQGKSVDAEVYRRKRDLLCSGLEKRGYQFIKPKGTFYLLPKAPGGDDLKFVEALQEELILTVPGRGFGAPGYFRIAFCVNDGVIERSMEGFARTIRAFI